MPLIYYPERDTYYDTDGDRALRIPPGDFNTRRMTIEEYVALLNERRQSYNNTMDAADFIFCTSVVATAAGTFVLFHITPVGGVGRAILVAIEVAELVDAYHMLKWCGPRVRRVLRDRGILDRPPPIDPLILDLDGNGLKTTSVAEHTFFDYNGDGFYEPTGWVAWHDGILAMDRNGDGIINNGLELFGDQTVLQTGVRARNGFHALAELDSNGDGKIDSADPGYWQLRVLKYTDEDDNLSRGGFLYTLDELGIKSIDLASTPAPLIDSNGNTRISVGRFERADGTTSQIGEFTFEREPTLTLPSDLLEIPDDINNLPYVRGYGCNHDLHQAMVRDTTGQLRSLVEQFVSAFDPNTRDALIEQILFVWTGSSAIDPESRGRNIDARILNVLERTFGAPLLDINSPNPTKEASVLFNEAYRLLFEMTYAEFMAQTHLAELYQEIVYTWDEEQQMLKTDFTGVIPSIVAALDDDPEQGKELLSEFARMLRGKSSCSPDCYLIFREHMLEIDPTLGWIFDTGGLPVLEHPAPGTPGWDEVHLFGTHNAEAIKGDPNEEYWVLHGVNGDDVVYGTDRREMLRNQDGDALLVAGGGNDRIWAGDGADIIDGGAGNDTLYGEAGNDTYIFRRGSGNDTIIDIDTTEGNIDTIWLGSSLTPDDVNIRRVGANLVVGILNTSDTMTVKDFFRNNSTLNHVEQIQFMDGTVLMLEDMISQAYAPSESDDIIFGTSEGDDLSGLGGRDRVFGEAGSDTLHGDADSDWLYGGAGDDLLEGGAAEDRLFGDEGVDILDGGADNDYLAGGTGNDTYRFDRGAGQDIIDDTDTTAGNVDTLELAAGILPTDVELHRGGNDLIVTIRDTGDSVTIRDWLEDDIPARGVELITFADGTIWETEDIQGMLVTGTDADDTIIGFSARADTIEGFEGSDTLKGRGGDDTLNAGAGDDIVVGGDGSDTLTGGAGNDALFGGDDISWYGSTYSNGDDTYVFGSGAGHDTILDHDRIAGNSDTIQLTDGITANDVTLLRSGEDLVLSLNNGADTLTIQQWFWNDSPDHRVEIIQFADGTTWDADTVGQMVLRTGTPDDDTLIGTSQADTLQGFGGNDRIFGREAADILEGGTGDDTIAGEAGSDTLTGGDGSDTLMGGTGADTLNGGAGSDTLFGGTDFDWYGDAESNGNDTYLVGRGSGHDTVIDYDATAGNLDTIQLAADITPVDVSIQRNGHDLVLSIDNGVDTVTVTDWFADESGAWHVEQIQFADATLWAADDIKLMVLQGTPEDDILIGYSTDDTIQGLAGSDTITGGAGADSITGGAGADTIDGGTGNDTYAFARGHGHDVVRDYDNAAGNVDTIALAADILPADVALELDGNDLIVAIDGTDDTLQITDWFADDASKIEQIQFSDGTIWDTQYILDNAGQGNLVMGTPADDTLSGGNRGDILMGLAGNDSLSGGAGNDTYLFSKGWGIDRIVENDSTAGNLDTVEFTDVTSIDLDAMERSVAGNIPRIPLKPVMIHAPC